MENNESQIRTAYHTLAPTPGAWVGLAEIAGMVDLTTVDWAAAIVGMVGRDDVQLVPESNQKTLTDEDREAAVWVGGEFVHLLAIVAPAPVPVARRGRRAA